MAQDTFIPQSPNLVESIVNEVRKPDFLDIHGRPAAIVPNGYELRLLEHLLPNPTRKVGTVKLDDVDSFIDFVKREGSLASCRIYADIDVVKDKVGFTAIMNDHTEEQANWRDYRAVYQPQKSIEWTTWMKQNDESMNQATFADFLTDNVKDIATVESMPTGAQMLAMAIEFHCNQEVIFKSALRPQSGNITFTFIDKEDDATTKRMELFERFALGIAPFFNGSAYQILGRLKYRLMGSKLTFWYELVRPDLALQDATRDLIKTIKDKTGFPVYYGNP